MATNDDPEPNIGDQPGPPDPSTHPGESPLREQVGAFDRIADHFARLREMIMNAENPQPIFNQLVALANASEFHRQITVSLDQVVGTTWTSERPMHRLFRAVSDYAIFHSLVSTPEELFDVAGAELIEAAAEYLLARDLFTNLDELTGRFERGELEFDTYMSHVTKLIIDPLSSHDDRRTRLQKAIDGFRDTLPTYRDVNDAIETAAFRTSEGFRNLKDNLNKAFFDRSRSAIQPIDDPLERLERLRNNALDQMRTGASDAVDAMIEYCDYVDRLAHKFLSHDERKYVTDRTRLLKVDTSFFTRTDRHPGDSRDILEERVGRLTTLLESVLYPELLGPLLRAQSQPDHAGNRSILGGLRRVISLTSSEKLRFHLGDLSELRDRAAKRASLRWSAMRSPLFGSQAFRNRVTTHNKLGDLAGVTDNLSQPALPGSTGRWDMRIRALLAADGGDVFPDRGPLPNLLGRISGSRWAKGSGVLAALVLAGLGEEALRRHLESPTHDRTPTTQAPLIPGSSAVRAPSQAQPGTPSTHAPTPSNPATPATPTTPATPAPLLTPAERFVDSQGGTAAYIHKLAGHGVSETQATQLVTALLHDSAAALVGGRKLLEVTGPDRPPEFVLYIKFASALAFVEAARQHNLPVAQKAGSTYDWVSGLSDSHPALSTAERDAYDGAITSTDSSEAFTLAMSLSGP